MVGKNAASATPIWALAAAIRRSAAAMSGRRSSSVDGSPAGITGTSAAPALGRDRQLGRRPADQHGDRVLELGAHDADRDRLGPRGFELGAGLRHVGRPRRCRHCTGSAVMRSDSA